MSVKALSNLSDGQRLMLKSLAITSSSFSIVAGSLMTYWFWKLKHRTFRHQIVMLLVVSDTFKAITELIYPAVTLSTGSDANNSFCTAFGFLTSVFVDASDFAILVIAINTALCIFFPSTAGGDSSPEDGIMYRYRHTVYACWALYSITLASLAFLNKNQSYVSLVSWCYLPIRPFYWRIALSWGPRYVILCFILVLYILLFFHLKKKFTSFHRLFAMSSNDEYSTEEEGIDILSETGVYKISDGPIAELATHNLLESTSALTSPVTEVPAKLFPGYGEGSSPSAVTRPTRPNLAKQHSSLSMHHVSQLESRRPSIMSSVKSAKSTSRFSFFGAAPVKAEVVSTEEVPVDELSIERARIVAQLRHLFIYPLVYLLMWIVPFAYHMTQYHDKYIDKPIMGMAAISAFIIPFHGLVDVALYARNEKPWRSWRYKSKRSATQRGPIATKLFGSGKTNKDGSLRPMSDMLQVDPNDLVARRHRDEIQEAEARATERARTRPSSRPQEWWDLEEETGSEKSRSLKDHGEHDA